jgi:hypothetical protein
MSDSLISGGEAQAEATEATESTEAVTQEATQAEQELLLGKYKSPDDLANAYKELEKKLGSKEEDLREKLLEELQTEAFKDRPPSAGEYELPETIDSESAVDSELLQWWSNHAFENGYSQEEFQKGIEMYAEAMGNMIPEGPDMDAELSRLGDNANQRVEAASMFANKFFPESAIPAIERMCETHEGIVALEHIMDALKDGSFAGDTAPTSRVDEQALREMMQDDRYHNPAKRDPHFVKQVEDGFRKLYG